MTLTMELAPEIERALQHEANRAGMPLEEIAAVVLERGLAEWEAETAQDAIDVAEIQRRLVSSDPAQRRTLQELRAAIFGEGPRADA